MITGEYLKQKELLETKQAKAKEAKANLSQVKQDQFDERVQKEAQLLIDSMPEWVDEKVRAADSEMIGKYLEDNGFTEADTNDLANHRVYMALHKAAKWDEHQSKVKGTEKKIQDAPKVVKASVKTKAKAAKSAADVFYG